MSAFAGVNDKNAPRAFSWIWFIRIVQIVFAFIVLGLAARDSHDLLDAQCQVTSKIAFNLACAIIAIILLVYLIFSTGPANVLKVLPWLVWGQIAIDAVMFVFWIAAAATSRFGCSDLCDACANLLLEYNLECPCQVTLYDTYPYANPYDKRDMSSAPRGLAGALEARRVRSSSSRGSRYVAAHRDDSIKARTAFDALMVILFFVTLCSTIWWVVKEKNLIGSFGSSAHANQPQAHQDAAGANVPMTAPQQPTATYAQPQMQQSQYYQEQTQPQTQYSQPQSGYPNPQLSSAAPIYTGGAPIAGH